MADDSDSLLREVEEELRREQMQKIWARYNGLILGVAAAIVFGVLGYTYLKERRIADSEARGAEFAAAMRLNDDKKAAEAVAAFQKLADSGSGGYAALARLHVAGADVKAGKTAEALATYEKLAKDESGDTMLRSFAKLQAASLRMSEASYNEIQDRIGGLSGEGQTFATTANELLGISAFKDGNFEAARKHLEPLLIDPAASQALQERIKIILGEIAAKEIGKAAGAPPPKQEAPLPAGAEKPALTAPTIAAPAAGTPAAPAGVAVPAP